MPETTLPKLKELVRVDLSSIVVEDRYRKAYGDLSKLKESIVNDGLIHPLSVAKNADGALQLMAGGRRYQALTELEVQQVECLLWHGEIDNLMRRRIELHENIHRKQLEWTEEVALTDEINKLETEARGGIPPTQAEVADLIDSTRKAVNKDLLLARALEKRPELAKMKSKDEALKALNSEQERLIKAELARRVQEKRDTVGLDKVKSDLRESYVVGDCFEIAKSIPDEFFNFVEADPPYGIDFNKAIAGRPQGTPDNLDEFQEVDAIAYPDFIERLAHEAYRVLKPNSWMICWCAAGWFDETRKRMEKAGFEVRKSPLIWSKFKQGRNRNPSSTFTVDYEMLIYARKGNAQLQKQGASSVFPYMQDSKIVHPTQKPIGLMEDIYSCFIQPQDKVWIPFAGSGNSIVAAANIGAECLATDLSQVFKDDYVLRVEAWTGKREVRKPTAEQEVDI